MDIEEPQLQTKIINTEEEEEFYENMEAPKFVDLTAPDPYHPDDCYWFCLRVGCDRKHEEEMDPEAIYKDFVLRVMAARSPNIRLRKALSGKTSSTKIKCPLSAPAKSSKSRISRLATVSSIYKTMVDPKGKVHPLVKPSSTQVPKTRQVAAKYMTAPRNKMCLKNPNPFLSVQNPKPTTAELPKNRVVAKALVFHSPKKNSTESHTPLRKICEGMKNLEMESQRKRILGYSSKSSKHNSNSKKSLPVDPSRKQLGNCMEKMYKGSLHPRKNWKDVEAKSIKCIKSNSKGNSKEECRSTKEEAIPSSEMPPSREISEELSVSPRCESNSLPNSDQTDSKQVDLRTLQALNQEGDSGSEENGHKNNAKKISKDEGSAKRGAEYESEAIDGDDKENALASDNYRHKKNHQPGGKVFGGQETHKNNQKAVQTLDKNFKDGATEVKYRKPKPTNPKPFRLRTDERGILKEADLERKLHYIALPKEGTTNESEKKVQNVEPKQNRATGLKTLRGKAGTQIATIGPERTSKPLHQKPISLVEYGNYNPSKKSENRFRKTKSPSQQQLVRPQGIASSRNGTGSHKNHGQRLGTSKGTSSEVLKHLEAKKPNEKLSQHHPCTKKLPEETIA